MQNLLGSALSKPYNHLEMQLGPSSCAKIPDGLMAAMTLLNEKPQLRQNPLLGQKPHQGVSSKNAALHPGFGLVISNTALGMPPVLYDEGVGSRYTGKERDTESGNDYFGARYYNSNTGRWLSPDWSASDDPVPYARLADPQTLNLYAYLVNDPLGLIDVDGHDGCYGDGMPTDCSLLNSENSVEVPSDSDQIANEMLGFAQTATKQRTHKPGRQPDGSYIAPTGPGSEIANIIDPAHPLPPMIGNGQCVTACSHFSGVTPDTRLWTEGSAVANNSSIPIGTAIATFGSNGRYPTNGDQNSGIYMGQGENGSILILDQWPAHPESGTPPHPAQIREMRFDDGRTLSNSAQAYHVIIVPR